MNRIVQWLAPLLALAVLAGVIGITARSMNATPLGPPLIKEETPKYSDVTVAAVAPTSYNALVTGLGESKPHYQLTLVAELSGRVVEISTAFETGQLLKKGDLILQLDDVQYSTAVATAESDLAQSQLDLLEEERQVAQARSEWSSSGLGGEPDSELVLRGPQLAAAIAAVNKANASLELAQKNLEKTKVTAPFDCLVVTREATPGSYLRAGEEIASLYSIDKMEVAVALSSSDWENLPPLSEIGGQPVTITGVENNRTWQGKFNRVERHMDTQTRQRTLVVEVEDPFSLPTPLLAGTFVRVEMCGKRVDNLWRLPGSALSQNGKVWYVTDDNILAAFQTEPVFSDHESIYILPPDDLAGTTQKILVHPLSSYLAGMKVNPVDQEVSNERS